MKPAIILFFSIFPTVLSAQNKFTGVYHNYFSSSIEIRADATFIYTWHFDMLSSWTKGRWTMNKDTIYFRMVPVFDTIRYTSSNGRILDTLQLSDDEIPDLHAPLPDGYLTSGGQNRHPCEEKLFFRKNRLYGIRSGKLVRRKIKSYGSKKKYDPWYFKDDDNN